GGDRREDVAEEEARPMPGRRVLDPFAVRAAVAHPDAVLAGLARIGRAPVDDDVMVEPRGHRASAVVLVVVVVMMMAVDAADVMVVRLLDPADLVRVADDLRAVLAQLAVH